MPTTKGRGRPSKLTPQVRQKLLEAIRAGSYYEPACAYAGANYFVFREWMRRGEGTDDRARTDEYAQFAKDVKEAEAQGELACVAALRTASKTDPRAAMWLLERRHSDRWSSTQKIKIQVEQAVDAELNLLFSAIADDPTIPNDVKLKLIEAAENLQSRAEVAAQN